MRRLPLAFVGLAIVATTASCLSPTLPLPPPSPPDTILESATGLWQVSGTCNPGAFVTVFDTASSKGVVVEDVAKVGLYHVTLPGNACDLVSIWQQTDDGNASPPTEFVLQNFANGQPSGTPCP